MNRPTAALLARLLPRLPGFVVIWLVAHASLTHAQRLIPSIDPKALQAGRAAALSYCSGCHLTPQPDELDVTTWELELLPKMRLVLGLAEPTTNIFPDLDVLKAARFFPTNALVPAAAWASITNYYLASAPLKLTNNHDQAAIQVGLPHFKTQPVSFKRPPQLTTLVHIDPARRVILTGDAESQSVHVLDPAGQLVSTLPIGNIPVAVATNGPNYEFATIGHFFPRDEPRGQVIRLAMTTNGPQRQVLLGPLPRLSDIQIADLNQDGTNDFTLCVYGNYIGRFSWFEFNGTNGPREHVLLDKPGAIKARIADADRDGDPDIFVLVAQALETLYLFRNQGGGRFEPQPLFQRPPSWGHSSFDLVDMNADDHLDLLVTNGDNADFSTAPPKYRHGVRIYLNDGRLAFKEAWSQPVHGAYKALGRDFDKDGDIDVAVIAFFPDYEAAPRESFIYFQNQGGLQFKAFTFRECIAGRWLTMDAGDIDGDGDEDIVLGSMTGVPTPVPAFLKDLWQKSGPSLIFLRNTLVP